MSNRKMEAAAFSWLAMGKVRCACLTRLLGSNCARKRTQSERNRNLRSFYLRVQVAVGVCGGKKSRMW